MENEPEAYVNDTLRSIAISPRERLANIEAEQVSVRELLGIRFDSLDKKLDVRFDAIERRLTTVETVQAGQASTTDFVQKATMLADEASTKARVLADEATKLAAELAKDASSKAIVLAEDQRQLDTDVKTLTAKLEAFDRKLAWFAGAGAVLVFVAGFVGYFIH